MARLLHKCLFILQIRQCYWTWNWKVFSWIKNCIKIRISLFIKGESEICPIFEIAIIVLSLKFISLFEAAAFSITNLFFPPSRFSLFSSDRSLCCLPHFAPTASRKKKTSSKKIFFSLWAQCKTLGFIEDYACKFHQEANGSKLSERWLAQLSENPVDCVYGRSLFEKQANVFRAVFSKQVFHQKETF